MCDINSPNEVLRICTWNAKICTLQARGYQECASISHTRYIGLHEVAGVYEAKRISIDIVDITRLQGSYANSVELLEQAWQSVDVMLVDLKIEFGRDTSGKLILADVIDNDSWRIWPGGDKNRMLDKQIYRNLKDVTEQDLQALGDRYAMVADLTSKLTLTKEG